MFFEDSDEEDMDIEGNDTSSKTSVLNQDPDLARNLPVRVGLQGKIHVKRANMTSITSY